MNMPTSFAENKVECNFNYLDVTTFLKTRASYELLEVKAALDKSDICAILNLPPIISALADIKNERSFLATYVPLFKYLYKHHGLLWSSIVIWDPLLKKYFFKTIKTDKIKNKMFDKVNELADSEYYRTNIKDIDLTGILFKKSIPHVAVLHKEKLKKEKETGNIVPLDVSSITQLLSKELSKIDGPELESAMEQLGNDPILVDALKTLPIPMDLKYIRENLNGFIKYLVWLQMHGDEWKYYYCIPATTPATMSLVQSETGGLTIAVETELNFDEVVKIWIVNSFIQEPISRLFNKRLNIQEVESKINLLEQTYHDITRRYLPIFENNAGTEEVAGLLLSKIDYLMHLARDEKGSVKERKIEIKDEVDNLFNLLDYDLKDKFTIDKNSLNRLDGIKITAYPGAFRTLFENLIGNTCKHAWDGVNKVNKVNIVISYDKSNKKIIYKDTGQGFPKTIDGIDIIKKIENWFEGKFSESDMEQRKSEGTIRGMGLFIAKQAAKYLNWSISPRKAKNLSKKRVQIEYHITWQAKKQWQS